ncbi:DedA family protein [Caproiciproducens sp. MSJ-32]|uniref:DedA family protein n=1 Tax=Caproiciproducens sp. MSJ-32 TaxID=2841527 RepID=UPI001C12747A|nr:DedA family protein [Caproiciproducens sp. MSJ-32]MBU5453997.1 DedA family protein [Caproiciproducens sp. MSJ-32]
MNNIQIIVDYISNYGLIFLFIIIFLEYLNFPGLGAAIVMPAVGIAISKFNINILLAILISVAAGELASFILFFISYWFGKPILTKIYNRFPKSRKAIDKAFHYIENYGYKGILIARIIPVARTLIPFVAGIFRMNLLKCFLYSVVGVTIWNTVLIYAGYAFGNKFI